MLAHNRARGSRAVGARTSEAVQHIHDHTAADIAGTARGSNVEADSL